MSQSNKTIVPHEKEVNVVKVAPNEKLIATGSNDKTIKIFHRRTLELKVQLKGHKRGIWDIAFNKFEKVLASASGDATIKLWNLEDGSVTSTFEGHLSSVVRIGWLSYGNQLISGSSDGVIKLWNTRKGLCLNTYEKHDGRLWSLDVYETNEKFMVVSGDNNSLVCFWEDCTKEEVDKIALEQQGKVNFFPLKPKGDADARRSGADQ